MLVFELKKQSTISDTLFSTPEYAAVLTVTLAMRLTGGVIYLLPRHGREREPEWEKTGYVGIILALAGWLYLVICKDNLNHFAGVAIFCIGSFMYSFAFIRLSAASHDHLKRIHMGLEVFLLVSASTLVITFVALWFQEEQAINNGMAGAGYTRTAYIVEHVSYLVHVLFYAIFFSFNSADPFKQINAYSDYTNENDEECGPCKPLIQMELRHHHILMSESPGQTA